MTALGAVAVVGASLAGLRATEALRREGYDGALSLIGAESRLPYDRPPLSKQLLEGTWDEDRLPLRRGDYADLELDLRLGKRAVALDLGARRIALDDGSHVDFDGLIIATGAVPRELPSTPDLRGIHLLRTLEDSLSIRAELAWSPRVAVVGAGFIGCEVAATCRARGLDVTLIEALEAPLVLGLGREMGEVVAGMHRDQGVDLRCGVRVVSLDGARRVERVRLSDGSEIAADVVVIGIGVTPATDWLAASGLEVADGVVCDATCAARAPGVFAAGDVARWYNPVFETSMRVEHWTNAVEQSAAAARALLAGPDAAQPFESVPYVWSDQYALKIQMAGDIRPEDEVRVVGGSVADRKFTAIYGRAGRLRGVLAFSRPRDVIAYRRMLAQSASWDDALAQAAG